SIQRAHQQPRRGALAFAPMRRQANARHWLLGALVIDQDAERRRSDFAVFEPLDSGIFHVSIPVDAGRPSRAVNGLRVGRVAEESRLARGRVRLPGLPMLGLALDDGGLSRAERGGAALGGDGLSDEIGARL